MGKKTIRKWQRVDCPTCHGRQYIMALVFVPELRRTEYQHRNCPACGGMGKVNKAGKEKRCT